MVDGVIVTGGRCAGGGGMCDGNRDTGWAGTGRLPGSMECGWPGMGIGGRPGIFGAKAMPGIGISEMPGYGCGYGMPGAEAGTGGKLEIGANDCVATVRERTTLNAPRAAE